LLVAEGGAGKSALVDEWLGRLRAENYRPATVVLGWSFFSQGSKERATAADEFFNWALGKLGIKLETTGATTKGEALPRWRSGACCSFSTGVEPLQRGPGLQAAQLKDQGLRALLRRFAAAAHGPQPYRVRQPPRSHRHPAVWSGRRAGSRGRSAFGRRGCGGFKRQRRLGGIDQESKAASRDFDGHPKAATCAGPIIRAASSPRPTIHSL
jgi:hypothetical protein